MAQYSSSAMEAMETPKKTPNQLAMSTRISCVARFRSRTYSAGQVGGKYALTDTFILAKEDIDEGDVLLKGVVSVIALDVNIASSNSNEMTLTEMSSSFLSAW
jgi:hypothetical protein